MSLINANKGKLTIQKQKISREHRQLISYVPQGNTLFSGTIRENITFGTPHATDAEIIEAAKQAYAWEFINKLDDKLDTRIGEKGLGYQKVRRNESRLPVLSYVESQF